MACIVLYMNTTEVYEIPMTAAQIRRAIVAAKRELSFDYGQSYTARTSDYLAALETGLNRLA